MARIRVITTSRHEKFSYYLGILILALILVTPALASAAIRISLTLDKGTYAQGQIVNLSATATNGSGQPVLSAGSAVVEIKNASRKTVVNTALTHAGNGVYTYQYVLPASAPIGTWSTKVSIVSGREKGSASKNFAVVSSSPPNPNTVDNDSDGFSEMQGDCKDADVSIHPGAAEICGDGIDQDCSGGDLACPVDPNTVDDDGDGTTENQGDCNDANATIHPGATEICGDGIDQDCSGADLACTPPPTDGHYGPDCIGCHGDKATEVHGSLHYQWQGPAIDMINQPGTLQGKMTNSFNSYCISILGNWTGCGACHIGKGAKPEAVATQTQLANIDCLKCHSQGGVKPTRADCLKCHAKAGGGDAVKRGDLALASGTTTDRNYDVHMATTGANLNCQSCHTTQNHRIAGKGSDLRATDLDVKIDCTKCHNAAPHADSNLNKHTARVACQTCHIPVYAKNAADTTATEATETFRTWKRSEATAPPLHPASTKANNLMPKYRFWNGKSDNYLLGDVAKFDAAAGTYPTSRPVGSVQDGKLYPFKYKTAEQPMTSGSKQLIALDTKVFFATADPAAAVRQGLINMGIGESTPWEWVQTDTFQMLNHQVSPSEQALQCANCHGTTSRMDLKGQLGYQLKAAQSTVCTQCHGSKDPKPFDVIHDKHVRDKQYDCSWCHTFSRPEKGLRMP
jgi:hypothetical protein